MAMAVSETSHSVLNVAVEKFISLVKKFTKIAESIIPKFVERVNEFYSTLYGIVSDLITNFETVNYEAKKLSYEAIEICQELKKMMSYCNAYMAIVNKFAWFAKREERKQEILQAFQQNDHNLAPLKKYIEQLKRPFIQAEKGIEELDKSFDGIQKRLQSLVENCEERLDKTQTRMDVATTTGGVVTAGGVVLAAGGVALAATLTAPTFGLGTAVGLLIAGAGAVLVGSATSTVSEKVTYCTAEQYEQTIDTTQVFASNLRSLRAISRSIQGTVTDVQQELKNIKSEIEEIETYSLPHESLASLTESLQYFFEELTKSGNRCSEFREELKQKEVLLERAILRVLSSELAAS